MSVTDIMSIEEFGSALIMTRDLDPVYVALHGAKLPKPQLYRWLLAYWCFYHMGSASWLSELEGQYFWQCMSDAAENKFSPPNPLPGTRWPRASERRYFRGEKCEKSVEWLRNRWPEPEDAIEHVVSQSCAFLDNGKVLRTEKSVMHVLAEWPLFGPWIGFKAADMLERCAGVPVQFDPDVGIIYDSPLTALAMLLEQRGGSVSEVYTTVSEYFAATPAPPALDRGCGPQEVETILCKWKMHANGRYTVGKDILEVRHALAGWGETADRLLAAAPREIL